MEALYTLLTLLSADTTVSLELLADDEVLISMIRDLGLEAMLADNYDTLLAHVNENY